MITRAIDSSGDWLLGKGKEDYFNDDDATAQNVKTRLQSFLGDCYFDLEAGIDWFTYLGSKNILGLRTAVSAIITGTLGIDTLTELNFTLGQDRNLLIQYDATTVWGTSLKDQEVDVG